MNRYLTLALLLTLTACGSGSEEPSPEPTVKGSPTVFIPADPDCSATRLGVYGMMNGYPERVERQQSELDRLLGAVSNETWYYPAYGQVFVFDWSGGGCHYTPWTNAHPRY